MIKHSFSCGIADDPTAAAGGQVLPSHWNADHALTGQIPAANGGTGQDSSAWSGLVKTTAGAWDVAVAGVDYQAALTTNSALALSTVQVSALSVGSLSGVLKAAAGLVGTATAGTDYQSPLTTSSAVALGTAQVSSLSVASLSGMLKASAGVVSAAVAGTDYQAPLVAGVDYQAPLTTSSNLALSTVQVSALSVSNLTGALVGSSGSVSAVAPGTSGNVLTSNGSAWVSSAPTGGSSTITFNNQTANYTVVAGDLGKVINCTANTFTVTLTAAATLGAGFNCWVWNNGTGAITISPNTGEAIDGSTSATYGPLRQGQGVQLICNGTGWLTGGEKKIQGMAVGGLYAAGTSRVLPQASGTQAVAIGVVNALTGPVTASASNSFAAGLNSGATGSQAVTGSGAMALGGSYASGTDSFAAATSSNAAAYGGLNTNAVAAGFNAKASGSYAVALGGYQGVASGLVSYAMGDTCTASASYSWALNNKAVANIYGKFAYSAGMFAGVGDAQTGMNVLRGATTAATPKVLTSDAGAAAATNQLILANNQAIAFRVQVIGRRSVAQADECRAWEFSGVIRRGANAASTTLVAAVTPTLIAGDAGTVTWGGVAVSADTTNGGLAITVTGEAAKNIRWVATVNSTEVIYA